MRWESNGTLGDSLSSELGFICSMFLEPAISRNQYQGVTKCQLEKVKVENETN